jgi:hypothetical protein
MARTRTQSCLCKLGRRAGRRAIPAINVFHVGLMLGLMLGLIAPAPAVADPPQTEAVHSVLWGQAGELWDRAGRLPDFSYAGYKRGESPIPACDSTVSVADFGAVGDGQTDDTAAFQMALRKAAGQTIRVPAGTFLITDMLEISESKTVLQGVDRKQSRLRFTRPLQEIKPNWGATTTGQRTSNYSWSGGFISVKGQLDAQLLASVAAAASRGSQELSLSDVTRISVGDAIRLVLSDDDVQSLARHLYQDDPGPIDNLSRTRTSFIARVLSVDAPTHRIQLDRPLTTDVKTRWSPRVYKASSSVEEVGIERLTFEFPKTAYAGHFTELGYNAIAMVGTRNCWIRDIHIHNCDSGIFLSGTNATVSQILFTSERATEPSRQATGHHGITLGGQDNLLSDFDYQTRFMHDITVSRGSSGNVAMRGRGLDLCFDHHRYAPHSNLFTEIDLGAGSRMFQSGGGAALGRHSAAWETFWGIASQKPQSWPAGWGPDSMNLVGLPTAQPALTEPAGRWFEPAGGPAIQPRNLYTAQLARRLNGANAQEAPRRTAKD